MDNASGNPAPKVRTSSRLQPGLEKGPRLRLPDRIWERLVEDGERLGMSGTAVGVAILVHFYRANPDGLRFDRSLDLDFRA